MTMSDVPLWATVHLTHAALQAVAEVAGADLLHIKGPANDPRLRAGIRDSTDADVLVRPAHVEPFLSELRDHGWTVHTDFADGSSFGHAANYRHAAWTYADVHRHLPGPSASPEAVFDRLWRDRAGCAIAHRRCAVPDLPGQVFVQALHAARSRGGGVAEAWLLSSPEVRETVRVLAAELGAEVALAAGIGELADHADRREHALWHYWSTGGDRLGEWRGRLRNAPTSSERVRVAVAMLRVNRTHLRLRLGHEPTGTELALEQGARAGRAGRELARRTLHWLSRAADR
jgi:hypothetical protein